MRLHTLHDQVHRMAVACLATVGRPLQASMHAKCLTGQVIATQDESRDGAAQRRQRP